MREPHDYETDPRGLAACLKEWQMTLNGGSSYGARPKAIARLRANASTYAKWLDGETPSPAHERLIRYVMSLPVA